MKLKRLFLSFIFLIIIFSFKGYSQPLKFEIVDVLVDNNKDTIFIHRNLGDWWIGAYGSVPFNFYFGKLNNYENYQIIPDYQINKITFSRGTGWGYQIGLMGEWKKNENKWGAGLFLALINRKFSTTNEVPSNDSLNTKFVNSTTLNYISFSPYIRYDIENIDGLYCFGGFDFDIPFSSKGELIKQFNNSEYIDVKYNFKYSSQNFRLGFQAGIGYEMFNSSISQSSRLNLSPYFAIHSGTNYLSDLGSSYNGVSFQLGVIIKFGPDKITLDTHKFNPNYIEPPVYLASVINEKGTSFAELIKIEPIPTENLDFALVAPTYAESTEKPTVETQPQPQEEKTTPQKSSIIIHPGDTVRFSYPTSNSTDLTQDLVEYLDAVAEFLMTNPQYRVIIEGHSDDRGTTTQNLDRSIRRSVIVMQYLLSKNVPRNRIITAGYGSVRPLVPNNSERNRAINRRVEIIILR